MKDGKKISRGITLISLVITIIVLLILAGVALTMLNGENGIIVRAKTAREQHEQGQVEEKSRITGMESVMAQYVGGTISPGETAKGENKVYSDGTNIAIIPEGWTISKVIGETTISTGLVIYDIPSSVNTTAEGFWTETKDNGNLVVQEDYNQFVWVPVSLASTATSMPRYEGYSNGRKQSMLNLCKEPSENGYAYESSEYTAMVNSVKANGGFYVGRYEASKNSSGKTESKKEKDPWINIKWGENMSNIGTSGAVYQSKQMYPNSSSGSVTSTLIYGCQWDAILCWIDSNFLAGNCESTSYIVDSDGKGVYEGSISKTGKNPNCAVKNIYDMAGNVWEWTMEEYNTNYRVYRGGADSTSGLYTPISFRSSSAPSLMEVIEKGFRVTLYL